MPRNIGGGNHAIYYFEPEGKIHRADPKSASWPSSLTENLYKDLRADPDPGSALWIPGSAAASKAYVLYLPPSGALPVNSSQGRYDIARGESVTKC